MDIAGARLLALLVDRITTDHSRRRSISLTILRCLSYYRLSAGGLHCTAHGSATTGEVHRTFATSACGTIAQGTEAAVTRLQPGCD